MKNKYHYIVVEGPIGAGKTSLAKLLAQKMRADTLLEDPDANPFLPAFYRDMQRHALATQLFFLFQRINQVAELKQHSLFDKATVSDFLLDKDPLFARLTLDDTEYALYNQIFNHLKPQAATPDMVIYLQAPAELLVERVKRRGHKMEKGISEEYLRSLADSYTRYFHQYSASPLLIVNSARINFVDSPQDFELLFQQITNMRGGREYFNRG